MADNLELLCSSAKIDRDRGFQQLEIFLKSAENESIRSVEQALLPLLTDSQAEWKKKHGALMGTKALLENNKCSAEFLADAETYSLSYLDDGEYRVRFTAGEVLGVLCRSQGTKIYESAKDNILEGIRTNLERQPMDWSGTEEQKQTGQLVEKLTGDNPQKRRDSASAEQIFHDTAGWKSLETYMKCLQAVIDGCGPAFNSYIDPEILALISQTLVHTNRFVRETGFFVCGSLVSCNYSDGSTTYAPEDNEVYKNGHQFADQLGMGLADNWSQVRMAASVATRQFLIGLPQESRKEFYGQILPAMCLNRYYVAEGVRIYNQDTWKEVTQGDGKHLLEQFIQPVVVFYISQTEADNHAVREAACACIAELGSKMDKDVVRPYVPKLLDALLVCFKDESWPVRDASCVACGNFVLCFPEESRATMDALYPLFFENLHDNIPSVRQGAAMALANVVRAYGEEALQIVITKVKEGLQGVETQPANVEKYSSMEKSPATYGVVKKLRDNDLELHSNRQMYSCGSLAPKMHSGKQDDGSSEPNTDKFRRPSEPWELADGCVYVLGELSQVPSASQELSKQLPLLAKASSHQHYTQHVHFLETLCKQIPYIAKGLGKKLFKMYLEMFFDSIFYSLTCDNALTSSAASQCINFLSTLLGPNILRGRVEQYHPKYLEQLSAAHYTSPY